MEAKPLGPSTGSRTLQVIRKVHSYPAHPLNPLVQQLLPMLFLQVRLTPSLLYLSTLAPGTLAQRRSRRLVKRN